MEIFNFDIIGEDMLLYNLKNTYSAKVLSHDTKLFQSTTSNRKTNEKEKRVCKDEDNWLEEIELIVMFQFQY